MSNKLTTLNDAVDNFLTNNRKLKVGLVGHGTGGHFYPVIAVCQSLRKLIPDTNQLELLFYGPDPYDQTSLDQVKAVYSWVPAGKKRNYFSIKNYLDYAKIVLGIVVAIAKLALNYPDVIFSKGGYASFPVLVAAKLLRIPIIIHDSDTVPGRVSQISDTWAKRVAVSWSDSVAYFKNEHVAVVGNPIRQELITSSLIGGREFLHIPKEKVVITILGGSSGATFINTAILGALPRLLKDFYVIHQVGEANEGQMKLAAKQLLSPKQLESYQIFGNLNPTAMARALGAADIVITRAGASGLFETALIGKVPAFVIPITKSVNDHQRKNAYAYQTAGCGLVIEEANLKPDIITSDIIQLVQDQKRYQAMVAATKQFSTLYAADTIATEIIQLSNQHHL